jgi:hypothetical protein
MQMNTTITNKNIRIKFVMSICIGDRTMLLDGAYFDSTSLVPAAIPSVRSIPVAAAVFIQCELHELQPPP